MPTETTGAELDDTDGTGVTYTGVPTLTVTTGIVTVPGAVIVWGTELTIMVVGSGQ